MTEKIVEKLLIDGVDVSECENLINDTGQCRTDIVEYCEWKPNCLYKQLKRKEQECELKTKHLEVAREGLKNIINGSLPCSSPCDGKVKCWDEITENGKRCMLRIANVTLRQIEEMEKH